MNVWRLNIKPAAKAGVNPQEFCFDRGLLGMGWPIDLSKASWEEYEKTARKKYEKKRRGWSTALNGLRNRMQQGDLCWTRDRAGLYYLGRVSGPWVYCAEPPFRDADIVNFRRCTWHRVGNEAEVPGNVAVSFARGGTLRRVKQKGACLYTACLYAELAGEPLDKEIAKQTCGLLDLLSHQDWEDLVGLYLQQNRGYLLVPSTCRPSTPMYEFVLVDPKTGEDAVVQVKSGKAALKPDEYSSIGQQVYLFAKSGKYPGSLPSNVECIELKTLEEWADKHTSALPSRMKRLQRFASDGIIEKGGHAGTQRNR